MITKLELSRAAGYASAIALSSIASEASFGKEVSIVKKPEKTMTVIRAKEPLSGGIFILGEALSVQCIVEIDHIRGVSVLLGDDFEKAYAAAVLDCEHTRGFTRSVEEKILAILEEKRQFDILKANEAKSTLVRFSEVGGDSDGD